MSDDLLRRAELLGTILATKDQDASAGVVAELMARIKSDAATIARLEGERERLALAICGGEDVPGYANAQPVEALEKVARDNAAAAMWQIDRTMKAEAQVAALVEALERIAAGMGGYSAGELARAAIAAAKEGA